LLAVMGADWKCTFRAGHIAKEQMSAEFIKLALEILKPALAKMMKEPKKKKQKTGG
jgi:hypothetical protein